MDKVTVAAGRHKGGVTGHRGSWMRHHHRFCLGLPTPHHRSSVMQVIMLLECCLKSPLPFGQKWLLCLTLGNIIINMCNLLDNIWLQGKIASFNIDFSPFQICVPVQLLSFQVCLCFKHLKRPFVVVQQTRAMVRFIATCLLYTEQRPSKALNDSPAALQANVIHENELLFLHSDTKQEQFFQPSTILR